MTTFNHSFDPPASAPAGTSPSIVLTPREIEDAGLLEVLQTPGVAMGSWSILEALLEPGNPQFVFREHLGRAREVKVAVSGLFGRFVARAYATKYLGHTHFSHIAYPPMTLAGQFNCVVDRVPGKGGDMPDWVSWSPSGGLSIVEAKGSHDPSGPFRIVDRAYAQAERAHIRVGGRVARFKRFAIATRWGFATGPFHDPMIAVKDPEEQGDDITREEQDGAGLGVVRRHFASLLAPLGHGPLADALVDLLKSRTTEDADEARDRAKALVSNARFRSVQGPDADSEDGLLGGFVVRGMPMRGDLELGAGDQDRLVALDLRPTFVGVDRGALLAAIGGILPSTGAAEKEPAADGSGFPGRRNSDTRIFRIDEEGTRVVE